MASRMQQTFPQFIEHRFYVLLSYTPLPHDSFFRQHSFLSYNIKTAASRCQSVSRTFVARVVRER